MAEYEEKGEDRISELPIPLLHNILSEFPMEDVVRTCILSKRWKYVWETFPFLNFDDENFYFSPQRNKISAVESRRKNAQLMKKAEQIVLRRCLEEDQNLLTLLWVIPKYKSGQDSSLSILPYLAKTGLRELSIINYYRSPPEVYLKLPSSSLILPVSIRKLYFHRLEGFKSLLPYGTGKFKYLSSIELDDVMVDDGAVNGLHLVCPYLESLKIFDCNGLENLDLTGLSKLRSVVLIDLSLLSTLKIESASPQIEILRIEFNANLSQVDIINTNVKVLKIKWNENLSSLDIINTNVETLCVQYNDELSHCGVDVANVDSVRKLKLHGDILTQDFFDKFISRCRFLKVLYIGDTEYLHEINISMDTIEIIKLFYMNELVEIRIAAPALRDLEIITTIYTNPPAVFWNFPNSKTMVGLHVHNIDEHNYLPNDDTLQIWQDFFRNFGHVRDLLLVCSPQFLIWLKRKGSVSPFPCVKKIVYHSDPPDSSRPILHLLESLVFLAPQATTMSLNNDANSMILSFKYCAKEGGETTSSSSSSSEFLGIEAWLLTVSIMRIQKYCGPYWEELIKFFSKFKNLSLFY